MASFEFGVSKVSLESKYIQIAGKCRYEMTKQNIYCRNVIYIGEIKFRCQHFGKNPDFRSLFIIPYMYIGLSDCRVVRASHSDCTPSCIAAKMFGIRIRTEIGSDFF